MTEAPLSAAGTYLTKLGRALDRLDRDDVDRAIGAVEGAWRRGAQVITLGNGGSAMIALHFIADWNKTVFHQTGRPFRGRSLVDNLGLVMAYANDIAFEDVFAEQLNNILVPGDLVVAVSGSGNSENVVRAVARANAAGAETLGLCGQSGGRLKELARHVVWAPVDDMQLCEDAFAVFGHMVVQKLCGCLEQ
jgi:D-sedoheptulose 7-phosphate isomerase